MTAPGRLSGTLTRGAPYTIVEVVSVLGNIANVRDRNGVQHQVPTDVLRSKGESPRPGEVWYIDRTIGTGWTFAAIVGYEFGGRRKATYLTRDLAVGGTEVGFISLAPGFRILHIDTTKPSRTRLYATVSDRTFDLSRDVNTIPEPQTGIIMDFLTVDQMLAAPLSPIPEGASLEASPDALIPISVTSVAGGPVAVTLTWVRTE